MASDTPRQDARAAFKAVLEQANLGVPVFDRMPYEGAEIQSVILTIVAGSSRRPALGNQISATVRALEEHYRLQVDCYHDDKTEADKLADAVEQAIMDNIEVLDLTYGIHDVRKTVDVDTLAPDPTLRESRILMDFDFYTHRALT